MSYKMINILLYAYIIGYILLGSVWTYASDSQDDIIVWIMIGYLFVPITLLWLGVKIENWLKEKKADSY